MWQIFPHIDKMDCRAMTIDGGAGPTMQASRRLLQTNGPQLTLVSQLILGQPPAGETHKQTSITQAPHAALL